MQNQKTRTDLLNHLAEKYQLKRYLEIGVQNPAQNFDKINCEYKVSVDPDPKAHATFCCTSDDFFYLNTKPANNPESILPIFDLVFIDGLHTAEQVKKDFENALTVLSPNGFIVLHDCNPLKEEHTIVPRPTPTGHWHGDVYRFACIMPFVDFWTVDIDCGCMVILPKRSSFSRPQNFRHVTWAFFKENREELLNLISWDELIATHSHV